MTHLQLVLLYEAVDTKLDSLHEQLKFVAGDPDELAEIEDLGNEITAYSELLEVLSDALNNNHHTKLG